MSTTSEPKTGKTDWAGLAILIAGFGAIGMLPVLLFLNSNEYNNLLGKTTNIGEEGYLEIEDFFFLNKDSAKYFTIKVTAIDVQNSNDDDKIVLLHATFKNIRYDVIDINHYSYYLITDEEHSYQSIELLTVDGTKVLKDTHKECVMKFNIPTDQKPIKLIIVKGDRIVKEIVLRYS
jgi:hypothetical protein